MMTTIEKKCHVISTTHQPVWHKHVSSFLLDILLRLQKNKNLSSLAIDISNASHHLILRAGFFVGSWDRAHHAGFLGRTSFGFLGWGFIVVFICNGRIRVDGLLFGVLSLRRQGGEKFLLRKDKENY